MCSVSISGNAGMGVGGSGSTRSFLLSCCRLLRTCSGLCRRPCRCRLRSCRPGAFVQTSKIDGLLPHTQAGGQTCTDADADSDAKKSRNTA